MPPRKRSSTTGSRRGSTSASTKPKVKTAKATTDDEIGEYTAQLARFALALGMNLVISAVSLSIAAQFLSGDLADVSRESSGWLETGAWLFAKTMELYCAWNWGLDGTCSLDWDFDSC